MPWISSRFPLLILRRSRAKGGVGLHEDHFVVVNIARFHRQKGQDVLVEAIARLKTQGQLPANLRILLVGGCEDGDAEAMLGKIKQDIANAGSVIKSF